MPQASYLRREETDNLDPLLRAIARKLEGMTFLQASDLVRMPNWKIGRILGRNITSPSYVDLTRLMVFAGISPNEGAGMAGLYNEDEFSDQEDTGVAAQVRGLLRNLRSSGLDRRTQTRLLTQFETLITAEKLMHEESVEDDARQSS